MRLKAARDGMREPVQVIPGNYQRHARRLPVVDGLTAAD